MQLERTTQSCVEPDCQAPPCYPRCACELPQHRYFKIQSTCQLQHFNHHRLSFCNICVMLHSKSNTKRGHRRTQESRSMCGDKVHRRKKGEQHFEGLSRLMGAVTVGTGEHIVSAPMASYLVRNGSRFKFSRDFQCVR